MNGISDNYSKLLTAREIEIFSFIMDGLSSRQIADKLLISEHTVSNHRKNMLRKHGVKKRIELVGLV